MVEVSLTVGKLDTSLALLLTKDHHLIEFPTLLLPSNVEAGSIVKITCDRDIDQENRDQQELLKIQDEILQAFGSREPSTPVLRPRNTTQTSVVLEWDPIDVATADIISLTLYKNGSKFGAIPTPLKRTATKLSGLAIDTAYTFHLKLATTAGVFESEHITVRTHKMTDLTGITICVGTLSGSFSEEQLAKTAKKIGAKPLQSQVKLDTTHFICTEAEGPQFKRAQDLNIPVVRPEWLQACEAERRLVGVRAYYLNADPKLRPPIPRSRAASAATATSSIFTPSENTEIPEVQVTVATPKGSSVRSLKSDTEEAPKAEEARKVEEISESGSDNAKESGNTETSEAKAAPETPIPSDSSTEVPTIEISEEQPQPNDESNVLSNEPKDDSAITGLGPQSEVAESEVNVPSTSEISEEAVDNGSVTTSNDDATGALESDLSNGKDEPAIAGAEIKESSIVPADSTGEAKEELPTEDSKSSVSEITDNGVTQDEVQEHASETNGKEESHEESNAKEDSPELAETVQGSTAGLGKNQKKKLKKKAKAAEAKAAAAAAKASDAGAMEEVDL